MMLIYFRFQHWKNKFFFWSPLFFSHKESSSRENFFSRIFFLQQSIFFSRRRCVQFCVYKKKFSQRKGCYLGRSLTWFFFCSHILAWLLERSCYWRSWRALERGKKIYKREKLKHTLTHTSSILYNYAHATTDSIDYYVPAFFSTEEKKNGAKKKYNKREEKKRFFFLQSNRNMYAVKKINIKNVAHTKLLHKKRKR